MAFWFPFLNFTGIFSLLLYNLIRKCSPNIFGESAFWSRVKLRFPLGSQHIIGYVLLQHVAVADHSLCTGRATCCATRFSEIVSCVLESLFTQQNFVAATIRTNSNSFDFAVLVTT